MLIDARRVPTGTFLDYDVCIVGAGPSGITLGRKLVNRGLRIVLVEGGSFRPQVRNQQMFAGDVIGKHYYSLQNVRFRVVGGSGSRWGGICRPLESLDLRKREWVEHSGWPIGYEELARHYPEAASVLSVDDGDFAHIEPRGTSTSPNLKGTGFEEIYYRLSPLVDFGIGSRASLEHSQDVTLLMNGNATKIRSSPEAKQVTWIDVETFRGTKFAVSARTYVLAAGGIENARLLLASNDVETAGMGNRNDVVGRYFMEHVHVEVATLAPGGATEGWSSYRLNPPHQPVLVSAIALSEEIQTREQTLAAAVTIAPASYSSRPLFVESDQRFTVPAERIYRMLAARGSGRIAASALTAVRTAWNLREGRAATKHDEQMRTVYYRGEQAPAPHNRVTLSAKRDPLGYPLADLHWTIDDRELANAMDVLSRFVDAGRQGGWGAVEGPDPDWRDHIVGGPHHLGTTRMSDDPKTGVVDADCKVHGIANLYVAGSSVFPTGGHANPTLTVMALNLRLAEHLLGLR